MQTDEIQSACGVSDVKIFKCNVINSKFKKENNKYF